MKIRLKIGLAFAIVVLLITSILSYVALNSVGKLGQRLESLNEDALLPLSRAEAINESLEEMQTALIKAINKTGSQQQEDLNEVAKREQEFITLFDKFEKAAS